MRKNLVKGGKIQVTGIDGRNFIIDDKDIKTGDSFLFNTKENKIEKIIKMNKGSLIYIFCGSKVSTIGKLENIKILKKPFGHTRFIEYINIDNNKKEETIFDYSIVIGEEKPLITVR